MEERNWRERFDKAAEENGGELPEHLHTAFNAAAIGEVLHREKEWAAQFFEEDEAGTFTPSDAVVFDDETGVLRISDIGVMTDDFGDISLTVHTADKLAVAILAGVRTTEGLRQLGEALIRAAELG